MSNCFEVTSKFGNICSFKSDSVNKGDKVYTSLQTNSIQIPQSKEQAEKMLLVSMKYLGIDAPQTKSLSADEIKEAFNQWLMLDEGVARFDYQLKHTWVAEQWERWQKAFKSAEVLNEYKTT